MKKNKMMRIASILLVAVLLSTCAISGTFAKYTTEATGTATASVAKWDIKLNSDAMTNAFTFDLFKTIVDTVDGNADEEVAAGKIAPGTEGACQIVLNNNSEVDAKFKVEFTETLDGIPITITYEIDGVDYTGNEVNIDMGGSVTIDIAWEWPFGETDNDNVHSGKAPSVTAVVTVEQRD